MKILFNRSIGTNTPVVVGMLLLTVILGIYGCGGDDAATSDSQSAGEAKSIRGTVVQVNESPEDGTESIVVEVGDQEITFLLGDSIDQSAWNPSHLKGHMIFEEAISVTYLREDRTFIAINLKD